jgi:hypothetical protein
MTPLSTSDFLSCRRFYVDLLQGCLGSSIRHQGRIYVVEKSRVVAQCHLLGCSFSGIDLPQTSSGAAVNGAALTILPAT